MRAIKLSEISISTSRQRKEFAAEPLLELSNSIAKNGLLHPIVVRQAPNGYQLVAGGRRIKAIEALWAMGEKLRYGDKQFVEGIVPCNYLGDLDPIDAFECELEENLRREDLSWQDRCVATSQLVELRRLQAQKGGRVPPLLTDLSPTIYPNHDPKYAQAMVHDEVILAKHLKDPDVASAATAKDGMKVIRRKEEASRNAALGERIGKTFSAADHTLIQDDCIRWMEGQADGQFDVILTDPPYGIDAQDFNDSGGKADVLGHTYNDSYDAWCLLVHRFAREAYRLSKPQAHCYTFCDIDNFLELRDILRGSGWKCFRTPLIWYNPSSQRAPWPQTGPHRRWQMCLYAIKGDRPVLKLASDLVEYRSDENLGWAAQKPVALYRDLLSRSCRAGDSVLDPFCGSGTIFPSAHELKVKAAGVELDPVAYGIAVKRLKELK